MAGNLDINKLMQQAQQMQQQMAQAQEQLASETVEASAGGGLVTVRATGNGEIIAIKIDPKRSTRTTRSCSRTWCSRP